MAYRPPRRSQHHPRREDREPRNYPDRRRSHADRASRPVDPPRQRCRSAHDTSHRHRVRAYLVTSTLGCVVAQRLVRRLCRQCRYGRHHNPRGVVRAGGDLAHLQPRRPDAHVPGRRLRAVPADRLPGEAGHPRVIVMNNSATPSFSAGPGRAVTGPRSPADPNAANRHLFMKVQRNDPRRTEARPRLDGCRDWTAEALSDQGRSIRSSGPRLAAVLLRLRLRPGVRHAVARMRMPIRSGTTPGPAPAVRWVLPIVAGRRQRVLCSRCSPETSSRPAGACPCRWSWNATASPGPGAGSFSVPLPYAVTYSFPRVPAQGGKGTGSKATKQREGPVGGMRERTNRTVSKTVVAQGASVQIPLPPRSHLPSRGRQGPTRGRPSSPFATVRRRPTPSARSGGCGCSSSVSNESPSPGASLQRNVNVRRDDDKPCRSTHHGAGARRTRWSSRSTCGSAPACVRFRSGSAVLGTRVEPFPVRVTPVDRSTYPRCCHGGRFGFYVSVALLVGGSSASATTPQVGSGPAVVADPRAVGLPLLAGPDLQP